MDYRDLTQHEAGVSVIIPAYNVESYLEAALQSVLSQTLLPCEIICVDDGSEDGTASLAREYEIQHPGRFKLLQPGHGGAAQARNIGLEHACGEYIQFLDADDVLMPGKLERQVRLADSQDPPADLVCGAFISRDEATGQEILARSRYTDCWANLLVGRGAPGVTSSNLFRKEKMISCGAWDTSRTSSQEPELMFRMMRDGALAVYDPEPLTLKLQRCQGAIWSSVDTGPNKIEQTIRTLNLRLEMLDYLVSRDKLTKMHIEAFSRGAGQILNEMTALDAVSASRQGKRIAEHVKEFSIRAGLD